MLAAAWTAVGRGLRRPLPGCRLQFPRAKPSPDDLPAHGDADRRHAADHASRLGVAIWPSAPGLFNIGAQGQIIIGAILAAWVGFTLHLPVGAAPAAGHRGRHRRRRALGRHRRRAQGQDGRPRGHRDHHAQLRGHLLGALPARHRLFQRPGSTNPISAFLDPRPPCTRRSLAPVPAALGLHGGHLATVFAWWLLNRSTIGFEFRAVGANPQAARTAGISVARARRGRWRIAGGLAGLAGVSPGVRHRKGADRRCRGKLRLRCHHRGTAGAFDAVGHVCRRPAVRRLPRRRRHHADRDRNPDRHRAGGPVAHRAVHRGPAAGPGDLPTRPLQAEGRDRPAKPRKTATTGGAA